MPHPHRSIFVSIAFPEITDVIAAGLVGFPSSSLSLGSGFFLQRFRPAMVIGPDLRKTRETKERTVREIPE